VGEKRRAANKGVRSNVFTAINESKQEEKRRIPHSSNSGNHRRNVQYTSDAAPAFIAGSVLNIAQQLCVYACS
jgi:hypothetical protein